MVVEPWLYGQSAGVSQVALLIAVIFWTWLWGPVGLLLATPLTVCLIVLGKHLPALGFIVVLMGDRPVIEAKARYYQRLLARDQDEAADIVETYVNADGRESVYDRVLLPALYYARQDRDRGLLNEDDAQFVVQATREILDGLAQDAPALSERDTGDLPVRSDAGADARIRIVGCPARDEADAVAFEMVRQLLDPARYRIEVIGASMLTAEVVAWVDRHRPALFCIGAVAPGGLNQARHLCMRLRSQCPELKIVVGRWGLHDEEERPSARSSSRPAPITSRRRRSIQNGCWSRWGLRSSASPRSHDRHRPSSSFRARPRPGHWSGAKTRHLHREAAGDAGDLPP